MADVRPFRGFRYDLGRTGALSDLIAPPYDVIDAALRAELAARSEYNAVRVELPEDTPGGPDKYTAAARTLNGWLAADAVRQDTARGLYVLEQEFQVEGRTHTRRGFLARVRVEPPGAGVFPHEETLAGPKADRLKLYQATGFNISPVFGLYPDAGNEVMARLAHAVRHAPPTTATDALGVVNRMWLVTDQAITSAVTGLMGPKPLFIADGHHRYETAGKYRDTLIEAGRLDPADADAAANFCLMHLVGLGDPGLVIRPTHRVIRGVPAAAAELEARLSPAFRVTARFGTDAAACWDHVQYADEQSALGVIGGADRQCFAVTLADPGAVAAAAPGKSSEWCRLAVAALHEVAVPRLGGEPRFAYHHELGAVLSDLAADPAGAGVLVPAVEVAHVEVIAGGRELMPPKSTYFTPKVPTGLVFHSLKRE